MLTKIRSGELREATEPSAPGPGQALIEIVQVGVCGSDMHYFKTGRIGKQVVQFPFTVGHECSGRVLSVGTGVTRVRPGDRVAVDPAVSCGECDQCRTGREHTCRHNMFLGCPGQLSGALTSRIVLPASACFPMPQGMTWEQAVMSEPFAIAVYAASRFINLKDRAVGVLGCGPIGLCVLEAARAFGARSLYATDLLPYRQAAAKRHHARWAGGPEGLDSILRELEPEGLDVVFECCGSQDAVDQAISVMKPGGSLLMVGIPEIERISLPIHEMRRKEIHLINVRRQVGCVDEALKLIADGTVNVSGMVTHHFSLERTLEAFEMVENYGDGVIKAMIEITPSSS